jgi:membrane carboxypeptidase/penicillin-binding protein
MTNVHGIRVFGGTFPALIWKQFMQASLAGTPVKDFELPQSDLIRIAIDPVSGLLSAPWCGRKLRTMLRQLAPTEYCPQPLPEPSPTPSPTPSPSGKKGKPGQEPSPTGSPDKDGKPGAKASPSRSPEPSPSPTPKKTPKH